MNVFECDRCGKTYTVAPKGPVVHPRHNLLIDTAVDIKWPRGTNVDLCMDCVHDFERFWYNVVREAGKNEG